MLRDQVTHQIDNIEFKVIYSRRRTISISVIPDSSIIVRVPYLTSFKSINKIIHARSGWIIKHRDSYKEKKPEKLSRLYVNGEIHLFRGNESVLTIENSKKSYCHFNPPSRKASADAKVWFNSPGLAPEKRVQGLPWGLIPFIENTINLGIEKTDDLSAIKMLLYKGYKDEAQIVFPVIFNRVLERYENQMFKPTGLIIRTMKRRWGSCSNKGVITLSTELIKLSDVYIEYVIIHELCHLKHHNHGANYYKLLAEIYPDWKNVRRLLKGYTNF
jgi:hypothetical protein